MASNPHPHIRQPQTSHGQFDGYDRIRPIISAEIWHPNITFDLSGPFCFVIDSGADHTFIVPHDEAMLGIPSGNLEEVKEEAHTFVGPVKLLTLKNSIIVFNDETNYPHPIPNIDICFAAPAYRDKLKPLAVDGAFPSVLGRDVLDKLSMGYCKRSNYLFVTDDAERYYAELSKHFPKPPRYDENVIKWPRKS